MHGNEIIIFVLLLMTGLIWADDNNKVNTTNVDVVISNVTVPSVTPSTELPASTTLKSTTTTTKASSSSSSPLLLLEDLVVVKAKNHRYDDDDDEVIGGGGDFGKAETAKRTISSRFTGPIVVGEQANLFTPNNDEFARKQRINVQIIEPEPHNNGQFLKQTVFERQENNTIITSTTTTTTAAPRPTTARRKNIVVETKYLAPIQAGLRLSNDGRQRQLSQNNDDDCDDQTERANVVVTQKSNRVQENVDIQQNTKIQKTIIKEEPRQNVVFGARVASTSRSPCDQSLPCSTPRPYRPTSSTVRVQPIQSTPLPPPPRFYSTPRIVTSTVVSPPRIVSTPVALVTPTPSPPPRPQPAQVHVKTVSTVVPVVTEKPVYIHTHSEVPVVQKEYVHLPPKIIEKPIVHKEFVQLPPQIQVVEKPTVVVQKEFVHVPPKEKIVPVEVEKLVVKEVPINNIIEKHIQHPPQIVEKLVPYPVASKPVEVEKIVEVPVDRVVEKPVQVNHIVEKPVAVPYVQYVERPIHIPYILPVEVPVAYHVPYLVKPHPPPPPKQHIIIKTTKYSKGHGLFDWKHNHHKHIKHVIFKKPNHIVPDDLLAPPSIDSIGLLPPPRYQPYISDDFGPKASASINVAQTVLPNSVHNHNHEPFFESQPSIQSGFTAYDNKLKYVDSFSKDIRWEYGFKPPLIPSVAIDEFGNPLNEHS